MPTPTPWPWAPRALAYLLVPVALGATLASCVSSPDGQLDAVSPTGVASGWAAFSNAPTQTVTVEVWIDGPAGSGQLAGTVLADRPSTGLPAGTTGDHGFSLATPTWSHDGKPHTLYAYAVDPQGAWRRPLGGSPRRFSVGGEPGAPATVGGWPGWSPRVAADPLHPPGVVVDHTPLVEGFVGSPSITILPNGHYVACHDIFTWGGGPTTSAGGITEVFRSTDRGATWEQVATLHPQFWSTVFAHQGALYLFGPTGQGGDLVIRRSTDEGRTWTAPTGPTTGLLRSGRHGGSPNRPVVHGGRLWIAIGIRAMSAPVNADLLDAASWSRAGGAPSGNTSTWLSGKYKGMFEGQVVASPTTGVLVLAKVKDLPYYGRIRVTSPTRQAFDPALDFIPFPGGEKKFGVGYDPVSDRIYAMSNPTLPRHTGFGAPKPSLVRNTAALYSSPDARSTWRLERVFLYHPNDWFVGFQYLNFELEGNDLVVIARTGFPYLGAWPPRQHDSNLMTFHRIEDFRTVPAELLPPELR